MLPEKASQLCKAIPKRGLEELEIASAISDFKTQNLKGKLYFYTFKYNSVVADKDQADLSFKFLLQHIGI